MRVSEIRVKLIRVNQGLGVLSNTKEFQRSSDLRRKTIDFENQILVIHCNQLISRIFIIKFYGHGTAVYMAKIYIQLVVFYCDPNVWSC